MPSSTIAATPSDVFNRNPGRLTLTMRNESTGGQKLYFALRDMKGLTLAEADYVLPVGGEKNFTYESDGDDIRNPVSCVSSAAGGILYAAETSIRRGE